MKPQKQDIQKILENYNLGDFKKFGKIMKDDAVSLGIIVYTTKKKVFLKIHKEIDLSIKQGLRVASKLKEKNYPVYKIYKTKRGKTYIKYNGNCVALIEYKSIKEISEWPNINTSQIKDFAKKLALFHKYTSEMNLKKTKQGGFEDTKELIKKAHRIRKRYNKKIQKAIEFMYENIDKLKCKKGEKKTGYYSEFNPGHVLFKRNKVLLVIDWEIGYNYRYYDIGSSLTACFNKTQLSYKKLNKFIQSYNSIQKLSSWDKQHIYEALLFGIFKYGVWGLISINTGKFARNSSKVDNSDLAKVNNIMKIDKSEFIERLK